MQNPNKIRWNGDKQIEGEADSQVWPNFIKLDHQLLRE